MPPNSVDPQVLTIESLSAMAGPEAATVGEQGLASRRQRAESSAILRRGTTCRVLVVISAGSCALARGAAQVAEAIEREILKHDLAQSVEVRRTGCHGFCEIEPMVAIYPRGLVYQSVSCADVPEIVSKSVIRQETVERLLYADPATGLKCAGESDIPFYWKQRRILLGNNSLIDPCRIEDYVAEGGYLALASALFEMTPDEVVDEIGRARLRSRINGGFPTARKWQACRSLPSSDGVRRVVCSADEGGTGAYMARGLLEGNPHSIIEGMIIGAYAVGACLGHIHVRDEYSLAARNLSIALEQARAWRFLGEDILGSGFSFDIGVARGRSAPICDQSESCFTRFDGRPGNMWLASGNSRMQALYSCPLVVDDLETWANVPPIVARGAEWYSRIGSKGSKGTKLLALVGMTRNTGLVEVPMGITFREIVHDIGGGTSTSTLKAIHFGGPTGSLIPASLIDTTVDYDELALAGAGMASSITVLNQHSCVVDLARYFTGFLVRELCGRCSGCGEGLDKMLRILDDLTEGRGMEDDIVLLEGLGKSIREASLCPQGTNAANPVLSGLKHFADEYRAHAARKRCPAGVCKPLLTFAVDAERCNGCQTCARDCPQQAISGEKLKPHSIDHHKCDKCRICLESCEANAILVF